MSTHAAGSELGGAAAGMQDTPEAVRTVVGLWWLWLLTGVAWIVAALVILQFDGASVTTVGIIIGAMFTFAAVEQLAASALGDGAMRWIGIGFAALFLVAGIVAFVNPKATFAGFADILGFLFLTVGVWWTFKAFLQKEDNPLWWVGLLSGILMLAMAFWTSGQFFISKVYTLLVFAGIWALMKGVEDIVLAFQVRSARHLL